MMKTQSASGAKKSFGGPRGGSSGGRRPSAGPGGGGGRGRGGRFFQKKVCRICPETAEVVNYKNTELLKRYLTEKGKILPRRITGNCAKCQREIARVIKRARHAALIAFQIES